MTSKITEQLLALFKKWSGSDANSLVPLPASGSYRQYFRIANKQLTAIGAYNEDVKENIAFLSHTRHFLSKGLDVPLIYAEDITNNMYLQQDLGDITLHQRIEDLKKNVGHTKEICSLYKKAIAELPKFQLIAGKDMDYSKCYPRTHFDKQSILWDLNYFKYHFLKLARISFDEQELENDFHRFADFLVTADCNYFLYRDFQSRNIMLYSGKPYYIDYQGGRRGAIYYDIASILFEAKTKLSPEMRAELLTFYKETLAQYDDKILKGFDTYYYPYALIRTLQACGAYGFRGIIERKALFLQSIQAALTNINWLLTHTVLPLSLPALTDALKKLLDSPLRKNQLPEKSGLVVSIKSFSYKKNIPNDDSGHGGGFIFDCRCLPNPGRIDKYKHLCGKDKDIIHFFEQENCRPVENFLSHVYMLIEQAVENYTERKFNSLSVFFGCTGGQHRSVYCAEKLARYLESHNVQVLVRHTEEPNFTKNKSVSA